MVFTALSVCLLRTARNIIGFGLMAFCFGALTGCPGGNSGGNPITAASGNGNEPTISLSPTSFAFSVVQGDANPDHAVNISNSGNGTLNWSLSATAPWLMLSPSSGSSSEDGGATFVATANLAGLAAGTYSATITISGTGAINSPQNIPVTLIISPPVSSTSTSTSTTTSPTSTTTTSTSPTTTASTPPATTASTPPTTTTSSLPAMTASTPPTTTTSTPVPTTASIKLQWDGTDPNVSGYYMHYGTQSPNVAGSCAYALSVYYSLAALNNASSPSVTISGLTTGTTYYFAVSSFDGLESPCSNEVLKAT